jgi:RNA polymerase sigma factor (sigma-70 family)
MVTTSRTLALPEHWSIFERSRRRLVVVASRILGSPDYAEDLVQEAALRWLKTDLATIRAPEGWLVAVVSRLAIDRQRRAFTERHAQVELSRELRAERPVAQPDDGAENGSELTKAFVLLRERLEPSERTAFALRELFDCSYAEIAHALAKSEAACRQIVHRARARLRSSASPQACHREEAPQLTQRFLAALRAGNRGDALSMLLEVGTDQTQAPRRHDACKRRGGAAGASIGYAAPERGRQRRRHVREDVPRARAARARERVVGGSGARAAPEWATAPHCGLPHDDAWRVRARGPFH